MKESKEERRIKKKIGEEVQHEHKRKRARIIGKGNGENVDL